MQILCLGDSLTYGYGVPKGLGWVETLQLRMPEIVFKNAGVNGDTLGAMAYRLERWETLTDYAYVFLMGGTNDILMDATVESCYQKYKHLFEEIIRKGSRPIIGIPMEMAWEFGGGNAALAAYRDKLLALAETTHTPVIDFFYLLQQETLAGHNVYDGDVHPNQAGYACMEKEAFRVFSDLLCKKVIDKRG